jgi:hypothetical protein
MLFPRSPYLKAKQGAETAWAGRFSWNADWKVDVQIVEDQ